MKNSNVLIAAATVCKIRKIFNIIKIMKNNTINIGHYILKIGVIDKVHVNKRKIFKI